MEETMSETQTAGETTGLDNQDTAPAEPKEPKETEGVSVEDIMEGAPEDPVSKAKAGTPKWVQKVIDQKTAKLRKVEAELNALKAKSASTNRPMPPDPDAFEDRGQYLKAQQEWKDQDDAWKEASRTAQISEREIEERRTKNIQRYHETSERMRSKYQDFDATINHTAYGDVEDFVLDSPLSPEIGYFLAKNPAELSRLQDLDGPSIAREIGKLEAKFETVQRRLSSNAPAPIKPVDGKDAEVKKELTADNSTMDEWYKDRERRRLEKIKRELNPQRE